jgi:CheY-like chemotaxis protein/HPt (histidine-containing phosphotransfer) domain-containing protein
MAQCFLAAHNIKADTALSGEAALRMIEEKSRSGSAYAFIFMDQMMPEMDGLETTKKIREWENKTGREQTPVIALTANNAADAEKLFLEAGLNDFILNPITVDNLNRVLRQWLSPDKLSIENIALESDDPLLEELSGIKGLDVKDGLANAGQNREGFYLALRQFASNCDSYIEGINAAVKTENWNDYSVKVHALKGVLAGFGVKRLSQWAANLEKASKDSSSEGLPSQICREETAPFCAALADFRDKLHLTSLFASSCNENKEKPKGDKIFLQEQIVFLQKACTECSFEDAEKTIATLLEFQWDSETGAALEKIKSLVSSYDFTEALEKIKFL